MIYQWYMRSESNCPSSFFHGPRPANKSLCEAKWCKSLTEVRRTEIRKVFPPKKLEIGFSTIWRKLNIKEGTQLHNKSKLIGNFSHSLIFPTPSGRRPIYSFELEGDGLLSRPVWRFLQVLLWKMGSTQPPTLPLNTGETPQKFCLCGVR